MQVQTVSQKPIVIGHRGYPGNPLNSFEIENTIGSFNSAWLAGADAIEMDVHLTTDGKLAVYHDDNLGRVFAIPGDDNKRLVSEYSSEDLRTAILNINGLGKLISVVNLIPYLNTKRIPLLEELIPDFAHEKLFIELKFFQDLEPTTPEGKDYLKRLVTATAEFIQKYNLTDQATVLSFVPSALGELKNLNPNIETTYLTYQHETDDPTKSRAQIKQTIADLQTNLGIKRLSPPLEQTTQDFIEICHELGIETCPWVWNQDAQTELTLSEKLLKLGVDGITTNQPGKVREIIDRL